MTYYAYLKDKISAAGLTSRRDLDQMIEAERNAFWQMLVTNPAYDERARMGALAAFDEAAGQLLSESERRFAAGPAARSNGGRSAGGRPETRTGSERSWKRDLVFLLIGLAIGLAAAYFGRSLFDGPSRRADAGADPRVPQLVASPNSFKFNPASPPSQLGEIKVEYPSGAADPTKCDVEVSYRQLLESVQFDSGCRNVSFKFLPLADLLQNFNYLQGYMVFTTTITSAGGSWKGTASVYFSVDASA